MDWSTIAVEIIERILVLTKSPRTAINASFVCKNWREIGEDRLLWKELFHVTSSLNYQGDTETDWKKKVMDGVLIRSNIKQGRCVVKTLSTMESLTLRASLIADNISIYKDFHLVSWQTIEDYGSYGDVTRCQSHFVNMINEECIELDDQEVTSLNKYIVKSPSDYYGGASFSSVLVHEMDPEKIRQGTLFEPKKAIKLNLPPREDRTSVIHQYYTESKYIGFCQSCYRERSRAQIVDAETGSVVFDLTIPDDSKNDRFLGLYDKYFAVSLWQEPNDRTEYKFVLIDVTTQTKIKKKFKSKYLLKYMMKDEIVFLCANKFSIWNYKTNTEREMPFGQVSGSIKLIYNDMWVTFVRSDLLMMLAFYDMSDGSKLGCVSMKNGNSAEGQLSQLSDGRLALCLNSGCHVISFFNTEVTRKIKVLLMDIEGAVKEHEIMACKIVQFYREKAKGLIQDMTSRVVPYKPNSENERYVMIFSAATERPLNETATALFKNAVKPTQMNTPYLGWRTDGDTIICRYTVVNEVYGPVMIVKEQKIDGRWQLV